MRFVKKKPGLRAKMLLYFGLLTVLTIAAIQWVEIYGIPAIGFYGNAGLHQNEVFRSLNRTAKSKKEHLTEWLNQRKGDILFLTNQKSVRNNAYECIALIRQYRLRGLKGDALWDEVKKQPGYLSLQHTLKLMKVSQRNYQNIKIADAVTGEIIADANGKSSGKRIKETHYFPRVLKSGEFHIQVAKEAAPAYFHLHFSKRIPKDVTPDDGSSLHGAILVAEISTAGFLAQLFYTGGDLGQTGEALLVDHESKILTGLKFPTKEGTPARPLEYMIKEGPTLLAAGGQEGLIETDDYRGETVLAAYRHIRITAATGWGLVVKIDRKEVFAPLRQSIIATAITGSLGILLLITLVFIISGTLSRPIQELAEAARQVETGNLAVRAHVTGSPEVVVLGNTFNDMVSRFQDWHTELEKEVQIRTRQLDESRHDLQDLVYIASHDLQVPLVSMVGFASHLLKKHGAELNEEARFAMERLKANAQRMHQLVLSLLNISRLNTVKNPYETFDPIPLVKDIIEDLHITLKEKGCEITVNKLPPLRGDKQRLSLVFRNVIVNAVIYGARRITVGFREQQGAFCIEDDGIGIAAHNLEKLFKPGERLKKNNAEGVGMGLAFCWKVIQQHGGEIRAESAGEGKGATFYFTVNTGDSRNRGEDNG
ncbi:MAG: HAMP domain-containing protein [bacterium]|nr:HAMP domain-containing protein [bacterium]